MYIYIEIRLSKKKLTDLKWYRHVSMCVYMYYNYVLKHVVYIYIGYTYSLHVSGWWYTYPSEKYESVGIIIPNIRKNEECSKPPTSLYIVDWLMGYGKEHI